MMETTWECTVCGYTYKGTCPPSRCPCCRVDSNKIIARDDSLTTGGESEWIGHKLADSMSAEQIEEYLKDAADIEDSVYRNKGLLLQMHFRCPKEPAPPPPLEAVPNYTGIFINEFLAGVVLTSIMCLFLFVGLAILLVLIFAFCFEYPASWGMLWRSIKILAILIVAGWILFSVFSARNHVRTARKLYNEKKTKYDESMSTYVKGQALWKYQVSMWNQEYKQIETIINTSKRDLKRIYSVGVLAPKYRSFAAVCSLLEYFQTGTCETMKEAYNKYDQELLLGHIVDRLDKISRSLEEIKQNQWILYAAIQSSNRLLDQLVQQSGDFYAQASQHLMNMEQTALDLDAKTTEILRTSAITAYCSKETQKEISFMRRMSQYEGIIGNSWP